MQRHPVWHRQPCHFRRARDQDLMSTRHPQRRPRLCRTWTHLTIESMLPSLQSVPRAPSPHLVALRIHLLVHEAAARKVTLVFAHSLEWEHLDLQAQVRNRAMHCRTAAQPVTRAKRSVHHRANAALFVVRRPAATADAFGFRVCVQQLQGTEPCAHSRLHTGVICCGIQVGDDGVLLLTLRVLRSRCRLGTPSCCTGSKYRQHHR